MNLELWIQNISATFPWYAQLLRDKQADLSRIESLPLITEELLTQHYYHAENSFPREHHSYLTSGTTSGKRKRIFYSDNDQRIYLQQRMDIIRDFAEKSIPAPVLIWVPVMRPQQPEKFFRQWGVM